MAAVRRLQKELQEIRAKKISNFRDLKVDENNMLVWNGLLVPDSAPYNKGAFKFEMTFPVEYPFKPPVIMFKTGIYHPNIDEKGQVCLPIIHTENWKPATKIENIITALVGLINSPEPDHPLRPDLGIEFTQNRSRFLKNAEDFTKKHSEKRPAGS